jgi:hypothetical protein
MGNSIPIPHFRFSIPIQLFREYFHLFREVITIIP